MRQLLFRRRGRVTVAWQPTLRSNRLSCAVGAASRRTGNRPTHRSPGLDSGPGALPVQALFRLRDENSRGNVPNVCADSLEDALKQDVAKGDHGTSSETAEKGNAHS